MYLEFYGLSRRPFSIVPNPELFFPSPKHRMALTYLEYGLSQGDSFVMLTGEIGAGKTTLIRHLLAGLQDRLEVAVVFNTNIGADTLLRMVLTEFEVPGAGPDKAANLDALNAHLLANHARGRRAVLIVDEAQNLSREALEEVRMLSNLHTAEESLLQIVLVGQPELRQRMQDPALAQLAQRISVNYHLGPLEAAETAEYVRHRLAMAGRKDDLFEPQALDMVHQHSGGVPRIINTLCDTALVYGYADGAPRIGPDVLAAVLRDRAETSLEAGVLESLAPAAPETAGWQPDGLALQRLANMEAHVARLAQAVDGQMQELKSAVDVERGRLLTRLETMLDQERERNRKLLAACAEFRQKIAQLEASLAEAQGRQPAAGRQDAAAGRPKGGILAGLLRRGGQGG